MIQKFLDFLLQTVTCRREAITLTACIVLLTGCSAGTDEIRVSGYTAQTELPPGRHGEYSSASVGSGDAPADEGGTPAAAGPADTAGTAEAGETGRADTDTAGTAETGDAGIVVYVCGAVANPDVYRLKADARVCEAIECAGGFRPDADTEWLNRAERLSDGEMLLVYTSAETARMMEEGIRRGSMAAGTAAGNSLSSANPPSSAGEGAGGQPGKVNLNTASAQELMTLPGIGQSKADAIIRYREENGAFASPEDVMNISGIKTSVYSKIESRITV